MGEAAVDRRAQVPFRHATQALGWAHEVEATDLTKVSRAIANMSGGSVSTTKERLTGEERHAQAAYVFLALMRHLTAPQYRLIRAKHLPPLHPQKREHVEQIAEALLEAFDRPNMPHDWVIEVVGARCGDRPYALTVGNDGIQKRMENRDWSRQYGIPESTLTEWRRGGRRKRGLEDVFDGWYEDAKGAAVRALREADMIP